MMGKTVRKCLKTGFAVLVLLAFVGALLYPVFASSREARKSVCLSHLKQLATASIIYQADHNELFPLRDSWMDSTFPYRKRDDMLHCPLLQEESKNDGIYGYCFKSELAGAETPAKPEEEVLIFESINLARNASGALSSMPSPGRHNGGNYRAFADGHAKWKKTP
jgi:prepilin-type processing-associated H-X9-DG protein